MGWFFTIFRQRRKPIGGEMGLDYGLLLCTDEQVKLYHRQRELERHLSMLSAQADVIKQKQDGDGK